MLSIRLPTELDNKLSSLASTTSRPKSFYVKEALTKYLEDMEDVYVALDRIANPRRKFLSSAELLTSLQDNK